MRPSATARNLSGEDALHIPLAVATGIDCCPWPLNVKVEHAGNASRTPLAKRQHALAISKGAACERRTIPVAHADRQISGACAAKPPGKTSARAGNFPKALPECGG